MEYKTAFMDNQVKGEYDGRIEEDRVSKKELETSAHRYRVGIRFSLGKVICSDD